MSTSIKRIPGCLLLIAMLVPAMSTGQQVPNVGPKLEGLQRWPPELAEICASYKTGVVISTSVEDAETSARIDCTAGWNNPDQHFLGMVVSVEPGPKVEDALPAKYVFRYSCKRGCAPLGGWTSWLNRDTPGGSGDYETLKNFPPEQVCPKPAAVECMRTSGEGGPHTCSMAGASCRNEPSRRCGNYEVRFFCPGKGLQLAPQ